MITEVLLIALYTILFAIWWQFWRAIKNMSDTENILNDDRFFKDTVDGPKEGIDLHKKQELLRVAISKGKLPYGKKQWTYGRVDKASNEIINNVYAVYKQTELNEKGEKTGKALGKHVIGLYWTETSQRVKIEHVKKLQQDVENDPIVRDQIADLCCLLILVTFLCLF